MRDTTGRSLDRRADGEDSACRCDLLVRPAAGRDAYYSRSSAARAACLAAPARLNLRLKLGATAQALRKEEMPNDLRCARALHAEEFQRVYGRPVRFPGASAGEARDGAAPVLGFTGGHRGPVQADGRGGGREAGLVAEPSALPARRRRVRQSGANAQRRLRRPGTPLPEADRLLCDAAHCPISMRR
jgi:hypothetical protein